MKKTQRKSKIRSHTPKKILSFQPDNAARISTPLVKTRRERSHVSQAADKLAVRQQKSEKRKTNALIVTGDTRRTNPLMLTGDTRKTNALIVTGDTRRTNPFMLTSDTRKTNPLLLTGDTRRTKPLMLLGDTGKTNPLMLTSDTGKTNPLFLTSDTGKTNPLMLADDSRKTKPYMFTGLMQRTDPHMLTSDTRKGNPPILSDLLRKTDPVTLTGDTRKTATAMLTSVTKKINRPMMSGFMQKTDSVMLTDDRPKIKPLMLTRIEHILLQNNIELNKMSQNRGPVLELPSKKPVVGVPEQCEQNNSLHETTKEGKMNSKKKKSELQKFGENHIESIMKTRLRSSESNPVEKTQVGRRLDKKINDTKVCGRENVGWKGDLNMLTRSKEIATTLDNIQKPSDNNESYGAGFVKKVTALHHVLGKPFCKGGPSGNNGINAQAVKDKNWENKTGLSTNIALKSLKELSVNKNQPMQNMRPTSQNIANSIGFISGSYRKCTPLTNSKENSNAPKPSTNIDTWETNYKREISALGEILKTTFVLKARKELNKYKESRLRVKPGHSDKVKKSNNNKNNNNNNSVNRKPKTAAQERDHGSRPQKTVTPSRSKPQPRAASKVKRTAGQAKSQQKRQPSESKTRKRKERKVIHKRKSSASGAMNAAEKRTSSPTRRKAGKPL